MTLTDVNGIKEWRKIKENLFWVSLNISRSNNFSSIWETGKSCTLRTCNCQSKLNNKNYSKRVVHNLRATIFAKKMVMSLTLSIYRFENGFMKITPSRPTFLPRTLSPSRSVKSWRIEQYASVLTLFSVPRSDTIFKSHIFQNKFLAKKSKKPCFFLILSHFFCRIFNVG